ncbi:uncharacterized protein PG986_007141 [Apiospora aurea]|uniref:Uncharacterized protein n=1 Tax=Apiospora aurea TaxID=335848 RepID=A0ABR1QBQ9_9PEZI
MSRPTRPEHSHDAESKLDWTNNTYDPEVKRRVYERSASVAPWFVAIRLLYRKEDGSLDQFFFSQPPSTILPLFLLVTWVRLENAARKRRVVPVLASYTKAVRLSFANAIKTVPRHLSLTPGGIRQSISYDLASDTHSTIGLAVLLSRLASYPDNGYEADVRKLCRDISPSVKASLMELAENPWFERIWGGTGSHASTIGTRPRRRDRGQVGDFGAGPLKLTSNYSLVTSPSSQTLARAAECPGPPVMEKVPLPG